MRKLAKSLACAALSATHLDSYLEKALGATGMPVVLGYHRVVANMAELDPLAMPAMAVSAKTFEKQLDWLGKRYRFVELDELAATLTAGPSSKRLAAITFDDGYRDVFENAFPILQRKGIPAAVFVVTDLVGRTARQLHDQLYGLLSESLALRSLGESASPTEVYTACRAILATLPQADLRRIVRTLEADTLLDRCPMELLPLDWEMLKSMQSGGMTIGSHGQSHCILPNEAAAVIEDELTLSKHTLEKHLSLTKVHFAYPDGQFTPSVVNAVSRAGYHSAYTTCRHRDFKFPLLTVPRLMMWEGSTKNALGVFSPSIMSCHVHGMLGWISGCQKNHRGGLGRRRRDLRIARDYS